MNETAWIFTAIAAFAVGYGIAYFAKNIGRLSSAWGVFSIILMPVIVIYLLVGAGMLADLKDVWLSLIFAGGFIFRMLKKE